MYTYIYIYIYILPSAAARLLLYEAPGQLVAARGHGVVERRAAELVLDVM